MLSKHHNLSHEFSQYQADCQQLKQSDVIFQRLWHDFHQLDKEINRTQSEQIASGLKRKRLEIQDQIYARLQNAAA